MTSNNRQPFDREKLARVVLDEMGQFVALLDTEGRVLEINRAAVEAAGLKLEDLQGRPFWEARWWTVSPAIQEEQRQAVVRAARGEAVRYEVEIYGDAAGDKTMAVDYSLVPVRDTAGTVMFLLAEGRNITAQKRTEELQRLLERVRNREEQKSEFFANVSHELRTPLALILGPAEKLLAEPGLTERQQQDLQVIARNASTLLKHVNDLLDLSKLDAGRMEMAYAEVDLGELLQAVAGHFDALAPQRQITYVVDAPIGLRAEVDSEKIERIVLNLLANAFKFTPPGGRIKCLLRPLDNDRALMSVEDSGPGVRPELRQRVFERFRRAEGDTAREFGQTGLGLAIARDFAELHGGSIGVTDAPGGGALFQVALPRRAPAGARVCTDSALSRGASDPVVWGTLDELKPPGGATTVVEASAQRPRALVVDDSPEMLRLVAGLLSEDFNVVTASDGATALEKAAEPGLDLIITDIMMPGMSGEQLIAAIRRRPELGNVPILILSAKANDALRARLLREGVQDYVVKPLSAEELRARALNLARVKRARDVLQTELMSQSHDLEALARQLAVEKQRALEAQRKADLASRAKDEFLAVLSHELRTPLNAILGWLTILRRAAAGTPEHQRALDVIERNARAQGRLVDDILDVSAMIQGRMRLRLDPLRLGPVLAAALDAIRPAAEAKGVEILSHCDERELTVHGDADRLRQVFYNLLNNAIKFTPEGGHVMVGAGFEDDTIVVSVQDTGIGIEAAFLPHVFDRFTQADSTASRRYSGLGLGLAVVRHLVELHGGTVHVESAGKGCGATFSVRLPAVGARADRADDALSVDPGPSTALLGLRLLFVEDDQESREMVTFALERHGAIVASATTVEEAIRLVDEFQPDLLLSDIGLPEADGYALLRLLHARGRRIPAIALTAYTRPEDRQSALSAGYWRHIGKPVDIPDLVTAISAVAGLNRGIGRPRDH